MSKEVKIKFYTEERHSSLGGIPYLCGEMDGNVASRKYRTWGWFQGLSIRCARKQIITELESTQNVYYTDTNQNKDDSRGS